MEFSENDKMNGVERKTPEWNIERISEDWYDYNRHNYDYLQLELLDENFKQAPPISVAQYKARTSEILPQGIFDEQDVLGIMIAGKGNQYNDDLMKKTSPEKFPEDISQEHELDDVPKTVTNILTDDKPKEFLQLLNDNNKVAEVTNSLPVDKSKVSLQLQNESNKVAKDEQLIANNSSKKPESQKKKKKKFKQFDVNNSTQKTSRWNQPWTPDFSDKFKNNKEFPPL